MRRQIEMKTNSPHSPHFARVSQMLTVFTLSSRARPLSLSLSLFWHALRATLLLCVWFS